MRKIIIFCRRRRFENRICNSKTMHRLFNEIMAFERSFYKLKSKIDFIWSNKFCDFYLCKFLNFIEHFSREALGATVKLKIKIDTQAQYYSSILNIMSQDTITSGKQLNYLLKIQ